MPPPSTQFPIALDTDDNLFLAHDALRMTLVENYNPGDTSIFVDGDPNVFARFPASGIITLTEQCSEIDKRAVSFYYSNVDYTNFVISGLILLPKFKDALKPKRITHITQNVMAEHHNHLKDALVAIETFIGIQGTIDLKPLGATLEGRINFLRKLVLTPKAYFSVDRKVGLVPLTVTFKDLSFRLGTDGTSGDVTYLWDFGDNTSSSISGISTISTISIISVTSVVPINLVNVFVDDLDGGLIEKTYSSPGIYTVSLTVSNKYGSDTIVWPDLLNARVEAPLEAVVNYHPSATQLLVSSGTPSGGPYDVPPVIRTPINTFVVLQVPDGPNLSNPGYSYIGERLTSSNIAIDPVVNFTWSLGDDLDHSNVSSNTRASYSIGGQYDMKLRVDTQFGAYRITTYPNSIDVIEKSNLWLMSFTTGNTAVSYEYGLISETFKAAAIPTLAVDRNFNFLQGQANQSQLTSEFKHNTGFAPRSTNQSGLGGDCLIYYASGRNQADPISSETVKFVGFNGFNGTYDTTVVGFARPWNWATFHSADQAYFAFGSPTFSPSANTSPANPILTAYNVLSTATTNTTLHSSNFKNGGQELLTNIAQYNGSGTNLYGDFSVHRAAWKDSQGYLARNSAVGEFFRIKNFYKTEGTIGTPIQFFTKLVDMPGSTPKMEGELVAMTGGLYFFNNSGSIANYNDTTGIWETTGPGTNASSFRNFQDSRVSGFDDSANRLLAASDGDRLTYLSFDYSRQAFTKFNSGSLTFSSLTGRPVGSQFLMGIY